MKTIRTLLPGQPGTKELVNKYGDHLVCVRYKDDKALNKRFKTIEIIIDEKTLEYKKNIPHNKIVLIHVAYGEKKLGILVKNAGGHWNKSQRAWELPYSMVVALGLEHRIKQPKIGL